MPSSNGSASSSLVPQQQSAPSSAPSSAVIRGRNRELQLLNFELQLLQEELKFLDTIPPASKACRDLVTAVESRSDPFFPDLDGVAPQAWPYDRPVKASRWCWKF